MKKILSFLLAFVMIVCMTGCNTFSEPLDISGEWVATDGEETISYSFSTGTRDSDGKITGDVRAKHPGGSMSCSYEISENGTISVFVHMPPSGSKNTIATFKHTTIDGVEVLDSNGLIFIKQKND